MQESRVLVCVDGSKYSKSACEYGIFIAQSLALPLVLLNVIEHSHISKKVDLSGNIGLGSKDTLLNELSLEEAKESKAMIAKGRTVLQELSAYAVEKGVSKVHTLQRHGTLEETLEELANETRIAIIGLKGEDSQNEELSIGKHVETIIRMLNIPILLVNNDFQPINSILMAYDGSDFANKAIDVAAKNPILKTATRHIVNVNKEREISKRLLNEAKNIFEKSNIQVQTVSLQAEDSVKALLEYEETNNLDIIAMGAYSHNRLRSVIFGSFTSKMLQQSKKPLLLFR
ncbi:universal stress protein [Candidatus Marinarcus aquaticus]|uniref:Universal stress protein n=1 Tax=Candidatus Marinarcus aquaticus TaxID=2044504 RepID=A0A4Q0XR80_9BACT|nr:universal stress protein [Candidatus Marinarcus aquaticus]RXJ58074.1 universal stress protein [Candidatus Marinarcus aquaticus]